MLQYNVFLDINCANTTLMSREEEAIQFMLSICKYILHEGLGNNVRKMWCSERPQTAVKLFSISARGGSGKGHGGYSPCTMGWVGSRENERGSGGDDWSRQWRSG